MSAWILVVDDEKDVETLFRQQFRRELRDGRFVMEFALSGEEALQKLNATNVATPILLVSDINMPGMSGLDLVPRAKEVRPGMPVLMITAYGDPGTREAALARGASDLLTKPIDFPALRRTIDAHVAEAGPAA